MHEWLIAPPFCDHHYPPPSKRKEQHDTPDGLDDHYTVAVAWRDPRDREVSLWAHSQSATSRKHDRTPKLTFAEFVLDYQPRGNPLLLGLTSLVDQPSAPRGLRDPPGQPPSRHDQLPADPQSHHRRPHAASDAATKHTRHRPWREHYTPSWNESSKNASPTTSSRNSLGQLANPALSPIVAITLRRDERQ